MAENPTTANPAPGAGDGEIKITPRIMMQAGAHYILMPRTQPQPPYIQLVSDATKEGYDLLVRGGSATDAVEKAVWILEASPYFNAGRGSVLNKDGGVECDAMIMDGSTMEIGAVMAVRHFKHPVEISKKIMEESDHCAFGADGALAFAMEKGLDICEPGDLITENSREIRPGNININTPSEHENNYGTVSAVALDKYGHFACATSTGGLPEKSGGRIGDAPLVGCGGYANEFGAATTSGHGESLMKMTLAREVVFNMERGQDAQSATQNAVDRMERCVKGYGCAIAVDKNGNFGRAANSSVMIWASMTDKEQKYGQEGRRTTMA